MATIDESPSAKRWLPLEANPDVMNQVWSFCSNFTSRFELWLVEREYGGSELRKNVVFCLDCGVFFGWDIVLCCVCTFSCCISIWFLCLFVHLFFLVVELRKSLLTDFIFYFFILNEFTVFFLEVANFCSVWARSILLKYEKNSEENVENVFLSIWFVILDMSLWFLTNRNFFVQFKKLIWLTGIMCLIQ